MRLVAVACVALCWPVQAFALTCESTPERIAIPIPTADGESTFDDAVFAEVWGGHDYAIDLPYGWQFALVREDAGWALRVFDRAEEAGRVDLTAVTPPFHLPTNARDLFGWHFRNADNTAPNTGEVNAPQLLRLFQFDPELTGTGGYRPPREAIVDASHAEPAPGRGWLRILDMGLSNLDAGERASFRYLKFQACLTLPTPTDNDRQRWASARDTSRAAIDAGQLGYSDLDRELLGACSQAVGEQVLEARVLPRQLTADIDGDGAEDRLLQLLDPNTNQAEILLCRGGTYAHRASGAAASDPASAHIVSAMEAWRVLPNDHGSLGYVGEPGWPDADGELVLVERIEKGALLLYWRDGALRSLRLYSRVEP